MKTELKNHICNRFYGISCEGPVLIERVFKNADISILSNLLAIFFKFFLYIENLAKYYLHANFKINWTIQTEITGGGAESAIPQPYQSAKSPACLGLMQCILSIIQFPGYAQLSQYRVYQSFSMPVNMDENLSKQGLQLHSIGSRFAFATFEPHFCSNNNKQTNNNKQ